MHIKYHLVTLVCWSHIFNSYGMDYNPSASNLNQEITPFEKKLNKHKIQIEQLGLKINILNNTIKQHDENIQKTKILIEAYLEKSEQALCHLRSTSIPSSDSIIAANIAYVFSPAI